MQLDDLNALDQDGAAHALRQCCGSSRWSARMAAARPFADPDALAAMADRVWVDLDAADWLESFAAHPRIGSAGSGPSESWSAQEQAGVADAPDAERDRLAQRNRDYEARFGYIFIVCASGRSAGEMLAILEARLANDPDVELRVAANEQRKITRLRLLKLLNEDQDTVS
jgi:OHCU decarboxylase